MKPLRWPAVTIACVYVLQRALAAYFATRDPLVAILHGALFEGSLVAVLLLSRLFTVIVAPAWIAAKLLNLGIDWARSKSRA